MRKPGVRAELIGELRRIGPKYMDAIEALRLTLRFMTALPGVYAVNVETGEVVTQDDNDVTIWAAIAQIVAIDRGIDADMSLCFDVATVVCRRSGVFSSVKSA